jgi:hypothetical protein
MGRRVAEARHVLEGQLVGGLGRLINGQISAQGPAGVNSQVPRGNDVRSRARRPLPKAKKAGKALRGWARTKLKRLRPHEKGSRSRVLPRVIKSTERQPRKIAKVSTRHSTNRERLHMMFLMAARENRNVETEGVDAESLWEDNPEDLVTDLMGEIGKDESRIPVFLAEEKDGGGISVGAREARYVRFETQQPLPKGTWVFGASRLGTN